MRKPKKLSVKAQFEAYLAAERAQMMEDIAAGVPFSMPALSEPDEFGLGVDDGEGRGRDRVLLPAYLRR